MLGTLLFFVSHLFTSSQCFAGIGITVNGQVSGASFEQGATITWNTTGIPNATYVLNEFWIDLNDNGIVDPLTDLLFVNFYQKDGTASSGDGPPGDDDGLENGQITSSIGGFYMPLGKYIFKVRNSIDSATATFTIAPLSTITYTISGSVRTGTTGIPKVIVQMQHEFGVSFAYTNASGNYSFSTNAPSGSTVFVNIPNNDPFNTAFGNYVFSPDEIEILLNGNAVGVNFQMRMGKIVTGRVTDNEGIPVVDLLVSMYPQYGGNGVDTRTNIDGVYYLSADVGAYNVQFGNDSEPRGYLKTYYNQKHVGWKSDLVYVSEYSDTIKNIDAVLIKGALIRGTFKLNGVSVQGNITAFAYNNSSEPLYETWHDERDEYYYMYVLPGSYSIQFTLNNNGGGPQQQLYFNQTPYWPGNAVVLNQLSDSAKYINVDFGSPMTYTFTGNGNWSSPLNWMNFLRPPTYLLNGDAININHPPGGQCILNVPLNLTQGSSLNVLPNKHLVVPGSIGPVNYSP